MKTTQQNAALSLALLVPAPSLGVLAGMVLWPGTPMGQWLFAASKLWLFALPVLWLRKVDRGPWSLSPVRRGGWATGLLTGLGISAVILGTYALWGGTMIDRSFLSAEIRKVGLGVPGRYAAGAAYWILVNSVLEEYVWRWFCVRQCERLWPLRVAVPVSALCFTLHHAVAMAVFLPAPAVAVCSAGVFTGGLIWSMLYARYRSVWPGYLSHAIVDLAIFGLGAAMVFGGTGA